MKIGIQKLTAKETEGLTMKELAALAKACPQNWLELVTIQAMRVAQLEDDSELKLIAASLLQLQFALGQAHEEDLDVQKFTINIVEVDHD